MYAPVYQKNKPIDTVEQRRATLIGWVYSPLRMNDLFNNIMLSASYSDADHIHLHIYDGQGSQAEHLLYDNSQHLTDYDAKTPHSVIEISSDFDGTVWTLQFEQNVTGINSLDYLRAWITLITGIIVSILIFLLLRSYLNTRINASNIAAKLTAQLQESESRFRVFADSAPVLIWLAGLDKLCYQFNKVWLDFTGRTLEQEYGNGWAEGVHPEDLQNCLDIYISSFDARLSFTMEYRLRRYDGEYRWILDNGVPRFSDEGIFLGYIGSCIDISEKKQVERDLQNESEKNAALLRNASDGIHILDAEGNIIEASDSFCIMLGYQREEVIGMNVSQWDAYFSPVELAEAVKKLFEKNDRYLFETRHRCKDGTILDVEVSGFQLKLDGRPVLFSSSRDITERKRVENALHLESEKNRALLRNASDGIHILDVDGNIIEASDSFCAMLGYQREEVIGMNVSQWDAYFSPTKLTEVVKNQLEKNDLSLFETRHRRKDGTIIDVEVSGHPLELNGVPVLFNSSRDITARKQMEEKLRESESHLRAIIENEPECIKIVDADGCLVQMNSAGLAMIEADSLEQVKGLPLLNMVVPEHRFAFAEMHRQVIAGKTRQLEFEVIGLKGRRRWLDTHAVPLLAYGKTVSLAVTRDVSEQKAAEQAITRLAFYDPLTGLPNRRKLLDRLNYAILSNHRAHTKFAVFMMDLDRFKAVNDSLGHAAGDGLLKQVAVRITECLRKSDMVARLGGDEFVLVLENMKVLDDAETIALKIIAELTLPFQLTESNTVEIGVSIGISIYPQHGHTVEELMDHADTALYCAKDNGRACFSYFSDNSKSKSAISS